MKTDDIYVKYAESLKMLEQDTSIFKNFKNNQYFNDILEHTDFNFGKKYSALIKEEFGKEIDSYKDIIALNDSIGNPARYDFDGLVMSPSNLRYIYHALLLESKCKKWFPGKKNLKILEIGGGYGGLCLYIKKMFSEYSVDYTIMDLPEPSNLQNLFLKTVALDNVRSVSHLKIDDLANTKFDLVISNYCISEIGRENQEEYFKKIIVNCDKKFFIWNYLTRKRKFFFFKTMDIDFINSDDYIFEPERTLTGAYNKFIYSK